MGSGADSFPAATCPATRSACARCLAQNQCAVTQPVRGSLSSTRWRDEAPHTPSRLRKSSGGVGAYTGGLTGGGVRGSPPLGFAGRFVAGGASAAMSCPVRLLPRVRRTVVRVLSVEGAREGAEAAAGGSWGVGGAARGCEEVCAGVRCGGGGGSGWGCVR